MAAPPSTWSPSSWRGLSAAQQPEWPDPERAREAREQLLGMPPPAFAGEARNLQAALAEVAAGRGFLLQAGDCAESFGDFSAVTIREKLKIMLQMAAVLTYGAMLPVVKVGRIAGQFVKPRSSPVEIVDGVEIPSFRGHMVHDDAPTLAARTPAPDGAQAEFFAGVGNPLGCKIGPTATPSDVVDLCARLDPDRTPGRLTLICRMGADRAVDALPPIIRAVTEAGHPVVWACDPMHANVIRMPDGVKTRRFEDIMAEIGGFFAACRECDVWPGGIHIEFTGEDVTESPGGAGAVL